MERMWTACGWSGCGGVRGEGRSLRLSTSNCRRTWDEFQLCIGVLHGQAGLPVHGEGSSKMSSAPTARFQRPLPGGGAPNCLQERRAAGPRCEGISAPFSRCAIDRDMTLTRTLENGSWGAGVAGSTS